MKSPNNGQILVQHSENEYSIVTPSDSQVMTSLSSISGPGCYSMMTSSHDSYLPTNSTPFCYYKKKHSSAPYTVKIAPFVPLTVLVPLPQPVQINNNSSFVPHSNSDLFVSPHRSNSPTIHITKILIHSLCSTVKVPNFGVDKVIISNLWPYIVVVFFALLVNITPLCPPKSDIDPLVPLHSNQLHFLPFTK